MSYLGIDIGTTGCKAVAYDEQGNPIAQAYGEYPLLTPQPGWAELDPERIWRTVRENIRQVGARTQADPPQAIALSVLGEAILPVTSLGEALANCIVSFDQRSQQQFEQFSTQISPDTVWALTGLHPQPHYSIFKLMWWQHHQPALYRKAWKFLCLGDFIGFRLGLQPIIDYTMATRTLAFDVHSRQWSPELLAAARLDPSKLPDTGPPGAIVGEISPRVAADLHISTGTKLVLGGLDQACAALGAGVIHPGNALLSLGTVAAIGPAFHVPPPEMRQHGILSMPHVVPDLLITFGASVGGGSVLRWYRDLWGYEEQEIARRTDRDVFDVILEPVVDKPTNLVVLPHLSGSRFAFDNPNARGAILGLSFDTSKADIVRALLEGVAYELALICQRFRQAGLSISSLQAVGGGSRSDTWIQIIADSLQLPIHAMKVSEAASLGAALLCARTLGTFPSPEKAVGDAVKVRKTFNPRPEWSAYHAKRVAAYRQAYEGLKNLYPLP